MRNIYYNKPTEWLELSVDNTTEANLRIDTYSGLPYFVYWGDGVVESYTSGQTITKVYSSNLTGVVRIATPMGLGDIRRIDSTGSTAWNFDFGVFVPLTGLEDLRLENLPNANITGSLNSFLGANRLTHLYLTNLPNANIDGSLNSFSGATGFISFRLTYLQNANITGSLNSLTSATGLTAFELRNLPNANIDGTLNSFTGANGLTTFRLENLPNANIDGTLNSFTGATGLSLFQLFNLPNANIDGTLNSFTGANGLTSFWLYLLPNANITGDSSAFSNKTNLRDFLLLTSPTSNITMNYDDILNIWQSSVYIIHRDSGISASKATTLPFNFDSLRTTDMYFQGIGLSTQSMDNMIIALDNSLIAQTSPKAIYLNQNAPHSGGAAVMTALSGLASKNITVVL